MKKLSLIIIIILISNIFSQSDSTAAARKAISEQWLNMIKDAKVKGKKEILFKIDEKIVKFKPEDKAVVDVLLYTGGLGTIMRFSSTRCMDEYAELREMSLRILRKLGGSLARDACNKILNAELNGINGGDSAVYTAGFNAIGTLGDDDNYSSSITAIKVFKRLTRKHERQITMMSFVGAIEALSKNKPFAVSSSLGYIETLSEITSEELGNTTVYHPKVQARAKKCMMTIIANAI